MEKIRCIAVDDETPALRLIEQYTGRDGGLSLVAKFRNPVEAGAWLRNNHCHILFLDVSMPQQSGIGMLRALPRKPITIFTTAYSEFAAEAFDLDAVDYLRKPFSYERFMKAVEKATDYLQLEMQRKSEVMPASSHDNFLSIKSEGNFVKVYFSEIVYIEAFQEYVKIYTDTVRYITYERMKNLEAILPTSMFMRVHRSYIISLNKVKSLSGNLIDVGGAQIPVSKEIKADLIKRIF